MEGANASNPRGIRARPMAARGACLWLLLGGSLIGVAVGGGLLLWRQHANAQIRELRAGKEVAVEPASAPAALLEARADFLLARGRIEEAQPLLDQAGLGAERSVQARMLYNMANARVRAALKAIEQGNFDRAIPLVALAKAEYRSVLRIEPDYWDAKHNLDVAMRLVRDLPRPEEEGSEEAEKSPSKLWTDLPGVPKGLP